MVHNLFICYSGCRVFLFWLRIGWDLLRLALALFVSLRPFDRTGLYLWWNFMTRSPVIVNYRI